MPINAYLAAAPADPLHPVDPDRYFNRELSWLGFNFRGLEQARIDRYPL